MLNAFGLQPISQILMRRPDREPAANFILEWIKEESQARFGGTTTISLNHTAENVSQQSRFADYIPRIRDLARFIDK